MAKYGFPWYLIAFPIRCQRICVFVAMEKLPGERKNYSRCSPSWTDIKVAFATWGSYPHPPTAKNRYQWPGIRSGIHRSNSASDTSAESGWWARQHCQHKQRWPQPHGRHASVMVVLALRSTLLVTTTSNFPEYFYHHIIKISMIIKYGDRLNYFHILEFPFYPNPISPVSCERFKIRGRAGKSCFEIKLGVKYLEINHLSLSCFNEVSNVRQVRF